MPHGLLRYEVPLRSLKAPMRAQSLEVFNTEKRQREANIVEELRTPLHTAFPVAEELGNLLSTHASKVHPEGYGG